MNIQRIAKQFAASAASQVIILGQTLLLPPIFIHNYGLASYGEWVVLSAAVGYLSTLQFGMQTYVNNELTMRYSRGEMAEYQTMQSTALRMLLGIAAVVAVVISSVFFLPVNRWLHLGLSQPVVATAVFFLGLQVLANLPMSYFAGTFMVFGMSHRGTMWQNISRVMMVTVAIVMAWWHAAFSAIAVGQFCAMMIYAALVLADLKRLEPTIFPTLRYWNTATARAILQPSGYFFLIYTCNFLVYQLPLLILQRMLGSVVVASFNIMRSIFSMMRQALAVLTTSIGPEVTNLFGRRDWASLGNLYEFSERLLFTLIPPLNVTALLLAPVLLRLWLHKQPGLYSLPLYAVMAAVSCAISLKDHKTQFQISTNHHREMARVAFGSYLVMIAASLVAIPRFGLMGFLVLWFATETGQAVYVLWLNGRLLAEGGPVSRGPALRMLLFLPSALRVAAMIEHRIVRIPLPQQGLVAIAFGVVLLGVSAYLFDLKHVLQWYAARRARAQQALVG